MRRVFLFLLAAVSIYACSGHTDSIPGQGVLDASARHRDGVKTEASPACTTAASLSSAILANSPSAYYKSDEASGTVWTDSSGNNKNGTFSGTLQYRQLALDTTNTNSLGTDGASTMLQGLPIPATSAAPSFSFSMVYDLRHAISSGAGMIAGTSGTNGSHYGWNLLMGSGNSLDAYFGYKTNATVINATLLPGQPYSIGVTYNASTLVGSLYLNGTLAGQTTLASPMQYNGYPLTVGKAPDAYYTLYTNGYASDVAFFSGNVLPQCQFQEYASFDKTLPTNQLVQAIETLNPTAYYQGNDAPSPAPSVLFDSSSNGNHGSIVPTVSVAQSPIGITAFDSELTNGTTGYLNTNVVPTTGAFSFITYVEVGKLTSLNQQIAGSYTNTDGWNIIVSPSGELVANIGYGSAITQITYATGLTTGRGYMVGVTYDGNRTYVLYINGVSVGTAMLAAAYVPQSRAIFLGADPDGSTTADTFANAYIDDSAYWAGTALSSTQMQTLAAFVPPTPSPSPSPPCESDPGLPSVPNSSFCATIAPSPNIASNSSAVISYYAANAGYTASPGAFLVDEGTCCSGMFYQFGATSGTNGASAPVYATRTAIYTAKSGDPTYTIVDQGTYNEATPPPGTTVQIPTGALPQNGDFCGGERHMAVVNGTSEFDFYGVSSIGVPASPCPPTSPAPPSPSAGKIVAQEVAIFNTATTNGWGCGNGVSGCVYPGGGTTATSRMLSQGLVSPYDLYTVGSINHALSGNFPCSSGTPISPGLGSDEPCANTTNAISGGQRIFLAACSTYPACTAAQSTATIQSWGLSIPAQAVVIAMAKFGIYYTDSGGGPFWYIETINPNSYNSNHAITNYWPTLGTKYSLPAYPSDNGNGGEPNYGFDFNFRSIPTNNTKNAPAGATGLWSWMAVCKDANCT